MAKMNTLVKLQSKCTGVVAEWDNLEWTVQACYKERWHTHTSPVLATAAKAALTEMLQWEALVGTDGEP